MNTPIARAAQTGGQCETTDASPERRHVLLDPAVLGFALSRPPASVARWATRRVARWVRDAVAPWRPAPLDATAISRALDAPDVDTAWRKATARPFPGLAEPVDPAAYERACPGDAKRIRAAAEAALARRVSLLGAENMALGTPVDWHRDFATEYVWLRDPSAGIDYAALGRACDVKRVWELSRLQWLIPAGQAYLLGHDPRHARLVRDVIAEWAEANPPGIGVNWTVPMEAAIRAVALIWLCRIFREAPDWDDPELRAMLLALLFHHGDFIARHLEIADVNGNHLTANAAGLVALGLFLAPARAAERWQRTGWRLLRRELPRQVLGDGVNFEASTAYHRLALELFLLPALCRCVRGRDVPKDYLARLGSMARFIEAYTGPDGAAPLWGDADDGRVLPFGPQGVNDHRYAATLAARASGEAAPFDDDGSRAETFWLMGAAPSEADDKCLPKSEAFHDAGIYVMRASRSHVFIDCGPIGLAGRGGHGHNDCLSFQATLDGVKLISDSGTFTYTGSVELRNRFRGTAVHNTPMVDGAEINRWVRPYLLWLARNDAVPELRRWRSGDERDVFIGAHRGYLRLRPPVRPVRWIVLDKRRHRLLIHDRFEGEGAHAVEIPFHFDPGVTVEAIAPGHDAGRTERAAADFAAWRLGAGERRFVFVAAGLAGWSVRLEPCEISPSYGVRESSRRLVFAREGALAPLAVAIAPEGDADDLGDWLGAALNGDADGE